METKKFSKGEAIRFGWEIMKKNFWFFVGILIIAGAASGFPSNLAEWIKDSSPFLAILLYIAGIVLSLAISLGLMKISLKFVDNKKGEFADLFSCFPLFFKFFFGMILYNLIVFVGTILLIIPGIIWMIKYQFFAYLIIDKGLDPITALKESGKITKGSRWNLFFFGIIITLINLLGLLCLLVGSFATFPTTMVATAFVYRKLLSSSFQTNIKET